MATPISYEPQSTIARAMFNFGTFGIQDFKFSGTVRVSVSDSFSYSDYLSPDYSRFDSGLWTSGSGEYVWTATQLENISAVLAIYSQYANISFQWNGDYDSFTNGSDEKVNPEDLGRSGQSDINISLIDRDDVDFTGISGIGTDGILGYTGSVGDIFINSAAFGGDPSFGEGTKARQALMHELGHSLGMSHPHTAFHLETRVATVSEDFAATRYLGFDKLGFPTASVSDMNKEYFTLMSYDDQLFNAFTPMILDVIALQETYGEGAGTTGTGNDTIRAGTAGYRTYFDKGGVDTIDLSVYSDGAYLNMGEDISGAPHRVGVGMSLDDGLSTRQFGGDPQHLRWFYGEYENALGSASDDLIFDNSLNNSIDGGAGNDSINVREGNDTVVGGTGFDTIAYRYSFSDYLISYNAVSGAFSVADRTSGRDGTDVVHSVEAFQFADATTTAASLIMATSADATPPTVLSFSPAEDAAGVAIDSNIVLVFSEAIQRGTGSIVLKDAAGTRIETFDAATSEFLTISGSTLTINPTRDLAHSANYYPSFASGSIEDLAGNAWAGTTSYDFTTIAATSGPPFTTSGTKARVFMGTDDMFTVSDNGATLIGSLGSNTVKIASGVTGVKTDANFSRIELGGKLADYRMGVVLPGTGLQIQTAAGVAVDTIVSLNTDVTLAFANGSATLSQTGISAFTLGGQPISTTAAAAMSVALNSADTSSFSTAASRTVTKAKVYMGADDTFTVTDSGAALIGSLGSNTARIAAGVTGVTTDANFSRIELSGRLADYKLLVVPGTGLQFQNAAGIAVDTIVSLNTDVTLAFADGSAPLSQTGLTAFTLGGQTISTTTPAAMSVALNAADKSSLGTAGASLVAAADTSDASTGDMSFKVHPGESFTYSVPGFAAGDTISVVAGTAIALSNAGGDDGIIDVVGTLSGRSVLIHLTGIAPASESAIFNATGFNTVFGADSLV